MRHALTTRVLGRTAALALLAFVAASPAQAYIDPGTGSMLLQVVGASVAGAVFYFRELRMKITSMFARGSGAASQDDSTSSSSDSPR